MEIYKLFFAIILVFGLLGSIRYYEPEKDLLYMHINVNNEGTKDLDDLRVKVLFYDLGEILQTNTFDLNDGEKSGRVIF